MNAVFIVFPILTLLMFQLGLELKISDFLLFVKRPKPVLVGLMGQLFVLPLLAFGLGILFRLEPLFFIGLMLIACSPGGSSSNIFSLLAKGDVALSVSLTALSSILTLFTIPLIMAWTVAFTGNASGMEIRLPVGGLIVQNLVLTLLPVALGVGMKIRWSRQAERLCRLLGKIAFPALILLASIFFIQHYKTIIAHFSVLGLCTAALILLAMTVGVLLSRVFHLHTRERRTIIIEIGMQNAAQAIAIASSPIIFNNEIIAIPAIIYALLMNVVLLTYIKTRKVVVREGMQ